MPLFWTSTKNCPFLINKRTKAPILEIESQGVFDYFFFFPGKRTEFQDMLQKCSKEISQVKTTAPGLPHSVALPGIVA